MKPVFLLFALCVITRVGAGHSAAAIPYPSALDAAVVVQSPMATEIPGSMILGNGDLNGILWLHQGKLRFTITKNDACDGRLDTTNDPDLCRIDLKNHKWSAAPRSGNPPSWDKPYPCPLICGHVEFGSPGDPAWNVVRAHPSARIRYDDATKQVIATLSGQAGESAGWGFVPRVAGPAPQVTVNLSGTENARWYLDFPGTGVNSGWQPATRDARATKFSLPAGTPPGRVDLYVWTNDGQPAEIRLLSVTVDGRAQSLAGAKLTTGQKLDARLDIARAVGTITNSVGMKLTARVLAGVNAMAFDTTEAVALTPCTANFIPASTRGRQDHIEWTLTQVPGDEDWNGMSFALAHAAKGTRHVVAVVTSFETNDPVAAAVKLAARLVAEGEMVQIARHEEAWRKFWSASGVLLVDTCLESVWYRNLYFLRCCSKPGVPPIGLFMGCATDVMPWHGCATTDYNFEQCFWGAFSTNHAELAEPYNRYIVDYLPRGKWFAKETYGTRGAFYPVNQFTHQIFDPAACKSKNRHMNFYLRWTYVPGANGWQAHNVWLAYLYHPDRDYLEKSGYLQLLGDTRGNYSEQMAATGIVSELLMQSVGDIIRIFPAWPKDRDASFTRLRAQGGFLVSAEQKDGKVAKLTITATVAGTLRLLDPRSGKILQFPMKLGESRLFDKTNINPNP